MAGTTALPKGAKGNAEVDRSATGWGNVNDVLGDDLGKFLRASRGRDRKQKVKVVASSEGGPATKSRVRRISALLDTDD